MTPEQIQALSAMTTTPATKESKTIDYKVSVANKAGVIKSVGIFKVWKRFSDEQIQGIIGILGGSKRVTIELLTGETVTSDDEF